MPNILALDSSTDACSVALHLDSRTTHIFELAAKSHTQRLLPMVDEILRAANCGLSDLDAIAYGRGPGSFTGLRICMGVVQGLAFGSSLPVIPVSTLQAMAQGFAIQNPANDLPLMVALDARMEEIYWSLFGPEPLPKALVAEYVMKPLEVCKQAVFTQLQKQFIALGPGWQYDDLSTLAPGRMILDVYPNAENMIPLAVDAFRHGQQISILEAQPVYLRDSVSWKKRERIRALPLENL